LAAVRRTYGRRLGLWPEGAAGGTALASITLGGATVGGGFAEQETLPVRKGTSIMAVSLIRGRSVLTHAIDRHSWNEITDGAVLRSPHEELKAVLSDDEVERRGCGRRCCGISGHSTRGM